MLELINKAIEVYEERLEQLNTQLRYYPIMETRILAKNLHDEVTKFLKVLYILKKQENG